MEMELSARRLEISTSHKTRPNGWKTLQRTLCRNWYIQMIAATCTYGVVEKMLYVAPCRYTVSTWVYGPTFFYVDALTQIKMRFVSKLFLYKGILSGARVFGRVGGALWLGTLSFQGHSGCTHNTPTFSRPALVPFPHSSFPCRKTVR